MEAAILQQGDPVEVTHGEPFAPTTVPLFFRAGRFSSLAVFEGFMIKAGVRIGRCTCVLLAGVFATLLFSWNIFRVEQL